MTPLFPTPLGGASGGRERPSRAQQGGKDGTRLRFAALLDSAATGGESDILTDGHKRFLSLSWAEHRTHGGDGRLVISRLIPSGDCALEPLRRGFVRASTHYDMRLTGELTAICKDTADSLHSGHSPLCLHNLGPNFGHTAGADSCWDTSARDISAYVLKACRFTDRRPFLSSDTHLPSPNSHRRSTLKDHSPPFFCTKVSSISTLTNSLLVYVERFGAFFSASGALQRPFPRLESQLSGIWLQVIPSQLRHRIAPAVSAIVYGATLGYPFQKVPLWLSDAASGSD